MTSISNTLKRWQNKAEQMKRLYDLQYLKIKKLEKESFKKFVRFVSQ